MDNLVSPLSGWIIWSTPLEGGEFGLPPIGVEKLVYPLAKVTLPHSVGEFGLPPYRGGEFGLPPQLAKVTPPFRQESWSTPPLPRLPPSPRLLPHRGLHVSD